MVDACAADVRAAENPGVKLGVLLGVLANAGRDKLTLVAQPVTTVSARPSTQRISGTLSSAARTVTHA